MADNEFWTAMLSGDCPWAARYPSRHGGATFSLSDVPHLRKTRADAQADADAWARKARGDWATYPCVVVRVGIGRESRVARQLRESVAAAPFTIRFDAEPFHRVATKTGSPSDAEIEAARLDIERRRGGPLPLDTRTGFPSFAICDPHGKVLGGG